MHIFKALKSFSEWIKPNEWIDYERSRVSSSSSGSKGGGSSSSTCDRRQGGSSSSGTVSSGSSSSNNVSSSDSSNKSRGRDSSNSVSMSSNDNVNSRRDRALTTKKHPENLKSCTIFNVLLLFKIRIQNLVFLFLFTVWALWFPKSKSIKWRQSLILFATTWLGTRSN